MKIKPFLRKIRWLGHAGIFIQDKPSIYIDPYNLAFPDISELILITTNDNHHCSPNDVKWLRKGATIIIAPPDCLNSFSGGDIRPALPGERHEIKGSMVEIFPAFKDKQSIQLDKKTGVGYLITHPNGMRTFHCGHAGSFTDAVPESVDILLIPVGEHADVNLSLLVELINKINPKFTIPIHWDEGSISKKELLQLNDLCQSEVVVLKPKR